MKNNLKINPLITNFTELELFLQTLEAPVILEYGKDFKLSWLSRRLSRNKKYNYDLSDLTVDEYISIIQGEDFMALLCAKYNIKVCTRNTYFLLYIYWRNSLKNITKLIETYTKIGIKESQRQKPVNCDVSDLVKCYKCVPPVFDLFYQLISGSEIDIEEIKHCGIVEVIMLALCKQKDKFVQARFETAYIEFNRKN